MAGHGQPTDVSSPTPGGASKVTVSLDADTAKDLMLALSQALGATSQPKEALKK
jgi:hypothetical protein